MEGTSRLGNFEPTTNGNMFNLLNTEKMKKLMSTITALSAVLAAAVGLTGCENPDNENVTPGKTVFELTQDTVNVSAEGGTASIGYKLVEPQEGASVQPDYTADWLGDFDASVEGTITFNVAANETEAERKTEVTVTYADQKDSFVVVQSGPEGGGEEPDETPFAVTVDSIGIDRVLVSVVPLDKEGTYDVGAVTPESLNTFPEDILFVEEYLIPYYRELAGANSMTIQELMSNWLLKGDQSRIPIAGLSPEGTYYVYCIGLTTSLDITTEFVKTEFTTEPLGVFDASISVDVHGASADVTVTPADDQTGYYSTVFNGIGHDDALIVESAQYAIEQQVASMGMYNFPREVIIGGLTDYGQTTEQYDLDAQADYTAVALTISADGYITSLPVTHEFKTDDAALSDNVITVDFTSVAGRKVEFDVNVTVPGDTYVFFFYQYTDDFKAMSEDDIIQYVIDNESISHYLRRNSVSTYYDNLHPKTEYVVYAFGYSGGVATTELFTYPVTTAEAVMNDCAFSYDFGPYYDGTEAAQQYPDRLSHAAGGVILPAKYVAEGEYTAVWHNVFLGDVTDPGVYLDETIYQMLREDGYAWMDMNMIYVLEYDQVYTLCGMVETTDGNFSALYRQKIGPFTPDGCSPIEGLAGWPGLSSAAKAYALDINNIDRVSPLRPGSGSVIEKTAGGMQPEGRGASDVVTVNAENSGVLLFTRSERKRLS